MTNPNISNWLKFEQKEVDSHGPHSIVQGNECGHHDLNENNERKGAPYLKESLFPYKIAILNAIKAFILVLIYFWYYYLITMKKKNQQAMLLEYASTASHRKKHFWTLWNQTEDNIHKIQGKLKLQQPLLAFLGLLHLIPNSSNSNNYC